MKDRIMNTEKLISLVKAQENFTGAVFAKASIKRIEAAEKVAPATYIYAEITYAKSRVKCELWTSSEHEKGTAGGYGYDRASAAFAEAARKCPSIDRLLFDAIEGHEEKFKDFLGYGCGYGPLPSLMGGVGLSCQFRIFNRCGLVGNHASAEKTSTLTLMTPEMWQEKFALQLKSE